MRESVIKIGTPVPLVGVLSEPSKRQAEDVALLLLNSGVMHRVGACRLSVKIARSVAQKAGLSCLRFDFSGIGDSEVRKAGGTDFDQGSIRATLEVMNHLEKTHGIRQFILYGLCSGALAACRVAELDDRVVAVAQVDGCSYPTWKSYLDYYASKVWSLEDWRNRLARWFRRGSDANGGESILLGRRADFEVPEFAVDPGQKTVSSQLQSIVAKGVKLRCIFTGREPHYRYLDQYKDCFADVDFGASLSLDYYPFASHIFTQPEYQREMVEGIVDWARSLNNNI